MGWVGWFELLRGFVGLSDELRSVGSMDGRRQDRVDGWIADVGFGRSIEELVVDMDRVSG